MSTQQFDQQIQDAADASEEAFRQSVSTPTDRFYDSTVQRFTEDRGKNVTTRWRNVAEALRDSMKESEAKNSALFSKMSTQLDEALTRCDEYTKARDALKTIFDATDPYADGAPDSGDHALLCNEISSIARPWKYADSK